MTARTKYLTTALVVAALALGSCSSGDGQDDSAVGRTDDSSPGQVDGEARTEGTDDQAVMDAAGARLADVARAGWIESPDDRRAALVACVTPETLEFAVDVWSETWAQLGNGGENRVAPLGARVLSNDGSAAVVEVWQANVLVSETAAVGGFETVTVRLRWIDGRWLLEHGEEDSSWRVGPTPPFAQEDVQVVSAEELRDVLEAFDAVG
jgi:hypothetical protein